MFILFSFMQMVAGMFLAFFGFIMAAFAGGWVAGDKVAIIIGLLLVAIGFLVTATFTSLMVRHINQGR
jgi:hypothetical protein